MNTLKTIVYMGALTALMVGIGGLLGGERGMWLALIFAAVTNFGSYWWSDKIALAMAHAQPLSEEQAPELYQIVRRLCDRAGLPMPRIYLDPSPSPNAFATGRDPEHAAVAVTEGIMRLCNWQELEGVLAHELSHVKNRDVLITTIASVMAATITSLAHWIQYAFYFQDDEGRQSINPLVALAMVILAPIAALLINLAISRSREYQADASGAKLCGHPEELASALEKLEVGVQRQPMTHVNPALGNLFIVTPNPLGWVSNLMSTHPPLEERIARLEAMSRQEPPL